MRTLFLSFALAAVAAAETRVTVVNLDGELGPSSVYLVKRSLQQARSDGSSLVVFEMNTPGGRFDSALDIANLIAQADVPAGKRVATAAYVRTAQSSGVLVAMACGRIVMEPAATIGSVRPMQGEGMIGAEKVNAWIAKTFGEWAEKERLPALLARGMVDADLDIREIEIDGAKRLVDGLELARLQQQGGKPRELRVVKAKGKLLNLTASEAREFGFSMATAESPEKAYAALGNIPSSVARISHSWAESFVGFITQGLVTGLLIALGFIFIWIEMKTPGVGVPALLATACFGLVFFGHYLIGMAQATDVLLFALGAVLLVVECLTPGFGIVGISGIVLILAGLMLALQNFVIPSNPYQWNSLTANFLTLTASTGAAVLGFAAIVRFLPHTPLFSHVVLKAELAPAAAPATAVLVGREGVSVTPLRPSGKVDVDGMEVDVVAEGEFVNAGVRVKVVKVEGPSVVVRRA